MRIEIPPRTTSEIWAAFLRHIAECNAALSPGSAPALITFKLPRTLDAAGQAWILTQSLPKRYEEHRLEYLTDGGVSELSVMLPVRPIE